MVAVTPHNGGECMTPRRPRLARPGEGRDKPQHAHKGTIGRHDEITDVH